jgi:hypothetical protein
MNMKTPNLNLRPIGALLILLAMIYQASATTYFWNVAAPAANNWNVSANWSPGTSSSGPASSDTAVFNATGTSSSSTTVNNVVSVNTTITSLSYTNIVSGQWHVTQILANTTLTVTGGATVGGYTVEGFTTQVAMTDAGTFAVTGAI